MLAYPPVVIEYRGASSYEKRREALLEMFDHEGDLRRLVDELESKRPDVARQAANTLCDLMNHRYAERSS